MKYRLLLLLAIVFAFSGCSEDEVSDRTYKIGMVPWAAYSPLNVADVKGFWTELDVDVEVISYNSNTDLNAALEAGTIDIALDMIGSWVDLRLQGKPITVLGETDWSDGGDKIIMKSSATVPSLKGSKLGVYLNLLSVKYFVEKFLQANGASLADFMIEEVANPDNLSAKFIDATYPIIANYDPAAAKAVASGGVVAATSKDYPGCIPEGFAARTDRLAGIPHEDLVNIFKGWKKAASWALDGANKTEFYQILKTKTFPNDNLSDGALDTNLAQVRIHTNSEQLTVNQAGGSLNTYFSDILLFAKSHGFPTHILTKADILDNSALIEALTP